MTSRREKGKKVDKTETKEFEILFRFDNFVTKLPLAKNGRYLLVLGDKMRLKSFDFLLFAKLPNWHEE